MSYTVYYLNSETDKQVKTLEEAKRLAEKYTGNYSYTKPFREEHTYLYGPGDGTASVMIREAFTFTFSGGEGDQE